MSDFFDDENLVEQEESKPEEEKVLRKKKKLLPKIIAGVLCLAILVGGTFAINKLIPEKEDDNTPTEFKTIDVLSIKDEDISAVSVTNENGTFKFVSETTKSDSSDSSPTKTWTLEGKNKDLLDSSAISAVITGVSNITAVRKITEKSADLCGLNNSKTYAEITKTDSSKITVYIGEDSPDNSGCYLKISESQDIYLVENNIKTTLIFDELSLASTESMPSIDQTGLDGYFTDGKLTKFDSLTVSGKNYEKPLIFVSNDENSISEYIPYKITSPEEHYADKIDDIIALFQDGVSVLGAYSFDASEISKFGLNSPDLVLSIKLGNKEFTNKFKLQEDGNYAGVSNNGKLIYKVSADTVSKIANGKPSDYYSSIISLFSIDKLKSLTIKIEGKSYDFGIKAIDDENSDDRYEITLDGKKLDCSSFQNLYQYILTFGCYDFTTGATDKTNTVSLVYNFKEDAPVTIDFEKSSDTKYQYSINGKPIGKIQSSKIDKLIKYTKKYVNGEKISELN